MNKPNGYDTATAAGAYEQIALGGHLLYIRHVEECTASNGKTFIKVQFDTTQNDAQPAFYERAYNADGRDVPRWGGQTVIFSEDFDGGTSRIFKAFCTSVEKSNPGFTIQWGESFCSSLAGKLVGGVFGEEEYLYERMDEIEVRKARKLRYFVPLEDAEGASVPKLRKLGKKDAAKLDAWTDRQSEFTPVDDDGQIPF